MAYLDTPRTDAGNATFVTNGHSLEGFSVENSILSPIKTKDDIISSLRNDRGATLRTPRARFPLTDRRNLPALPNKAEFTPLLQSVHKNNLQRNGKRKSGPETPLFLKNGQDKTKSPALPETDPSMMYGSDFGSSVIGGQGSTPVPQIQSSSAQSTPLAALPKRDATGVINDQGNLLTLREQENIIDKIEKENFGLKLKIHFLEDALRRSGPGFNEAALKENTDIKVDRILLQKELGRCKKTLSQAERDIELYKRHLEEAQARSKKQQGDENMKRELEELRAALRNKDEEIEELREELNVGRDQDGDFQKLKDQVEDLEAELRQKDQELDDKDAEIDRAQVEAKKDSEELAIVIEQLDEEKMHVQDLEAAQKERDASQEKLQKAQDDLDDALAAQRKAENDLDELHEEMANKSVTTKGLSRQLEEKLEKNQAEIEDLRLRDAELQHSIRDKNDEISKLRDEMRQQKREADDDGERVQDHQEQNRRDREEASRRYASLEEKLHQTIQDLRDKSEEKDLLHARHDALTNESQTLQKDLARTQCQVIELESSLRQEKAHAEDIERQLQSEAKVKLLEMQEQLESSQRRANEASSQSATDKEHLEAEIRDLKSQKAKVEEQAAGLQRTIGKLQETEGTLSGSETKLQGALDSEKKRHEDEEAVLQDRIEDLKNDIEGKRSEVETLRNDLSEAQEDLRVSEKEQGALETKVQELEDEVAVLQDELEGEEAEKARKRLESAEEDAEHLHDQLIEAQQKLDEFQASAPHETNAHLQELRDRLQQANGNLETVEQERQALQDRQATTSLELHNARTALAVAEAERDEIRNQLNQRITQVDDTLKLDQERINLKTAKLRLEAESGRLRDEKELLIEKVASLEEQLDAEIARSSQEQARLVQSISDLERKASLSRSSDKERELGVSRRRIQGLETELQLLQDQIGVNGQNDDNAIDLSILQKELASARDKEADHMRKENEMKHVVRELKTKVAALERRSHEAEVARLASDSPKSSSAGSARKSEMDELRRQLLDAQRALRELRSASRAELKQTQDRLAEAERRAQLDQDAVEAERERLESDLAAAKHEQENLQTKHNSAASTITRLRTRISSLEQDLRTHRHTITADNTIAEERADLHEMLKDAKLEAEDLQAQITARESSIQAGQAKEKELRTQLRRIREDRSLQTQKSDALANELDALQTRYEKTVSKFSRNQRKWESEKKAMVSKVRFPNVDTSSLNEPVGERKKRHEKELRGLGKQIQWLRAKCKREEGFRMGLVMEKKYLGMQVAMFEACNKADLDLLSETGISAAHPSPSIQARLKLGSALRDHHQQRGSHKRPSLKAVGMAVIAVQRMQNGAEEWREKKVLKEELERKMLGMGKRKSR